jgi:hypothetical protein
MDAGRVEARTEKLRSYGDVRWVRVITSEVAEALQQCREPLLALVGEMTRAAGDDAAFVEQCAGSFFQCRDKYVSGAWDYAIWRMIRA